MQRVSSLLPTWDRSKSPGLKSGGFFSWVTTPKTPTVSTNSDHQYGKEHYWPTNLDRECEKAARILQSFCTDGFDSAPTAPSSPRTSISSQHQQLQSKKKIPPRIVQNAAGLAIFSCMRSGLWMSGSGGSGILIARKSDGSWSPPSGFLLHTAALGFVIGVDIYDCVLVINSVADLEMFTRPRVTLGTDVNLSVGPLGISGLLENDVQSKQLENTVLTYIKAKGEHRPVNIDGSLVSERGNENERFYGTNVAVMDILAGDVRKDIPEITPLYEVIKAAEGRVDFDAAVLESLAMQPAPGDAMIKAPNAMPLSPMRPAFGVPDVADPDPFGVKMLEMAGLEIRQAGSRDRPTSSQFDYNPSPTSAVFHHRQSTDTYMSQSNRGSYTSNRTTFSRMTDAYTQTNTRGTTPASNNSDDGLERRSTEKLPVVLEPDELEAEEIDYTKVDTTAIKRFSQDSVQETESVHEKEVCEQEIAELKVVEDEVDNETNEGDISYLGDERDEDADDEDEDEEDDEEEPVIFEVATASQPQRAAIMSSQVAQLVHAKGAIVTIQKKAAPSIPPRSPARSSCFSKSEFSEIPMRSPLRNSFQSGFGIDNQLSKENVPASPIVDAAPASTEVDEAEEAGDLEEATQSHDHLSLSGHRRTSSSVYTTVIEHRLSMEDFPRTPSTLHTSGTTSGEEDHEPRTPRPEEETDPIRGVDEKNPREGPNTESNHETTPIALS